MKRVQLHLSTLVSLPNPASLPFPMSALFHLPTLLHRCWQGARLSRSVSLRFALWRSMCT